MKTGSRLLLVGAAILAAAALELEPSVAAPMMRDAAMRLTSLAQDAAEFCLPGWRLNFRNRCVPKRRRWGWFR